METVGEDDPYGALVKFCRPTSSQEQKLQSSHFARADETFPDAFDSLGSSFSQAMTQSPPPVIAMVSLSDSDEEDVDPPNDDNAPVENDVYQTPPEEHNTSYGSSQEEIQRNLQLLPVVGEKTEAEIGNDGNSAPGLEITGLPEQLEATRDGKLNKFGISGENSGEPPWKKIRVSGVNWESPMLDTVEEEEVIAVIASQQASDYADDVDVDDGELINMVIESDEEIGSDGAGNDEEIGSDGAGSDEEIGPDGAGNDDGEGMSDCVKNGGERSVSSDGDLAVEELGNGKKSVSSDGDLEEKVQSDSGVKSAGMEREDICAFKYVTGCGGGDNGDQHSNEVVRKNRELPASMREKGSDREGKKGDKVGDNGNVGAKVLSWKELFDRLAKIVKNKKVDCDAEEEDTDFLETAKRRGMTFPTPRWKTA